MKLKIKFEEIIRDVVPSPELRAFNDGEVFRSEDIKTFILYCPLCQRSYYMRIPRASYPGGLHEATCDKCDLSFWYEFYNTKEET